MSFEQLSFEQLSMDYAVRALTVEDEPILWTMLMYAAQEPSLESVQKQPYLSCYVGGWGRVGDVGFGAFINEVPVGAVWLRLWSDSDRGFGYTDPAIPELAMAVLPEYRGEGVGTKLLTQILETAQDRFPAVCLNVRANNPVVGLYQRAGFIKVEGSDVVNRTGGISFNMICKFTR